MRNDPHRVTLQLFGQTSRIGSVLLTDPEALESACRQTAVINYVRLQFMADNHVPLALADCLI